MGLTSTNTAWRTEQQQLHWHNQPPALPVEWIWLRLWPGNSLLSPICYQDYLSVISENVATLPHTMDKQSSEQSRVSPVSWDNLKLNQILSELKSWVLYKVKISRSQQEFLSYSSKHTVRDVKHSRAIIWFTSRGVMISSNVRPVSAHDKDEQTPVTY